MTDTMVHLLSYLRPKHWADAIWFAEMECHTGDPEKYDLDLNLIVQEIIKQEKLFKEPLMDEVLARLNPTEALEVKELYEKLK